MLVVKEEVLSSDNPCEKMGDLLGWIHLHQSFLGFLVMGVSPLNFCFFWVPFLHQNLPVWG
uniref:Uncharacterized protein n=1 Tax=Rhizophora mucronata TaxID=61149 RepID=A0A2P2MZI4_RHIMU